MSKLRKFFISASVFLSPVSLRGNPYSSFSISYSRGFSALASPVSYGARTFVETLLAGSLFSLSLGGFSFILSGTLSAN
jgi:hypothetical protein